MQKHFRLDLYHRLSVIIIHVPSLNERRDDIPMLVDQFLEDICTDYGIAKKAIDDDAIKLLKEYNWTGNIRELRNVVERLVILSGKRNYGRRCKKLCDAEIVQVMVIKLISNH